MKILLLFLLTFLTYTLKYQHYADSLVCQADKNQYYDDIQKVCKQCPPGSPKYNKQLKICQCCPNNLDWNQKYEKCVCPNNKPVFHPKKMICTACPNGYQFDKNQNQCFACPQGFIRGQMNTCVPGFN